MRCQSLLVRVLLVVAILGTMRLVADDATFSEKYADKLITYRFSEDGETFVEYDVLPSGSFSFSGTFFVDDPPVANEFNADTFFAVAVGEFMTEGTLGDDAKYKNGKSSATIAKTTEGYDEHRDRDVSIAVGKITLKFTTKGVKVTITMKTGIEPKYGAELAFSPAAAMLAGESGSITGQELPVHIQIGDYHFQGTLTADGKGTVKTVTKGRGDEAQEFELNTVTLKSRKHSLEAAE